MLAQTDLALWVAVLVVVIAVSILFFAKRAKGDLSIVINNGDVRFSGAIPQAKQATIRHFLMDEMHVDTRVTIRGRRVPQGWRFAIDGQIPLGDQQRIRNFLLMTL